MKKILTNLFLLALITFAGNQQTKASHLMGVDLTYECINNCTIRVHLRAYRDCTGSSVITNNVVFTAQTPGCALPTPVTGWSAQQTTEVTPICNQTTTRCTTPGAAINGVQEFYWWRDYNICNSSNCIFTMSWTTCCRNPAITSLVNPASTSMYIGSTTLNTGITPCNSSPQFLNPPVPYICAGQPFVFNQGAYDPDGDSLAYSFGPCYNSSAAAQVTYQAGFSPAQPLGPSWNVTINSATGDIVITPQPGNNVVAVMCVYVEEWRNGVLINTIVRDIQVTTIPCPGNNLPSVSGLTNVSGGVANGFTVYTCGGTVCFDIPTTDPDPGQTVTISWNQQIPGGQFYQTGNPSVQNTIPGTPSNPPSATFCWTPTGNGTFSFVVDVEDNNCPIIGTNQFTIQIIVAAPNLTTTIVPGPCGEMNFCANPVGPTPFTYLWTGAGGLTNNPSATDSCITHTYPLGTFGWQLEITDSAGCVSVDTGTIVIANAMNFTAGQDPFICNGASTQLGGPSQPGYTYSWSPTSGLNNPNISSPTATLNNTSGFPTTYTYVVSATDNNIGCTETDTVVVTVWPQMFLSFAQDSTSCFGGSDGSATVSVNSGGMPQYTFQWGATTGNQQTATATGLGAGPYTVTVTDSAGCTASGTYNVQQPNPIVLTTSVTPVSCFGGSDGTASVQATGGTGSYTYQWDGGAQAVSANNTGLSAGPWNVTVTDVNGCSATASVNITEPTLLTGTTVTTASSCAFTYDNGTAGVIASGGTPGYSYLWSDPLAQTTPLADSLSPGSYTVTVTDANGCIFTTSVNVGEILPPTVTAGLNTSFCEGDGGAQITATASGGTPGYFYTWTCGSGPCGLSNVNASDPIANPPTDMMYYIQVIDTNGCPSNIDSVYVTILPKPIVDAGPDLWLCGDGAPCEILTPTITGASGPYTFNWMMGAGLNDSTLMNPCARPDTTTAYTLVVTAGNGCESDYTTTDTMSTVIVHVNPVPVAEAGPDKDVCEGFEVQLEGYGYGAGPDYDFEWSPANGLSNVNIPNPMAGPPVTTSYTLVVWSNGCPSYADTVVVSVHTNPTVDAGPDRDICLGESAILDGQAGGDSTATYNFVWTPDIYLNNPLLEDPVSTPEYTTMYYVQAVTNWGCESPIDSALITLRPTPIADAGDPPTLCFGEEVILQGGYYYTTTDSANPTNIFYAWSPNSEINDSTLQFPTITPTASGYYYLQVYTNDCYTMDSVFVTVVPEMNLTAGADTTTICETDAVGLWATGGMGGATFTWSPSTGLSDSIGANINAIPGQTTTYTVIAGESGCYDTASVTIKVIPQPDPSYLNSIASGCAPHSVSFMQNSTDAISYMWDFGDGTPVSNEENPIHVFEEAGTYVVTLTAINEGGCRNTVSTTTVNVGSTAVAEFSTNPGYPVEMYLPETNVSFINESENGVKYLWEFSDGFTSSESDPSHTFTEPGTYQVTLTVTDENGCVSTVVHGPFIVITPDLYIPNVFSPNADGVNDFFQVIYTGSQPFTVEIFDRWGGLVFNTNNKNLYWNGLKNDKTEAPMGVYFYNVKIGDKEYAGSVTLAR